MHCNLCRDEIEEVEDIVQMLNLQQIPSRGDAKELRRLFGARKGYIMLSSDFSQQEPRTLAHMSGDISMQNAYASGKDLYSTMAAEA